MKKQLSLLIPILLIMILAGEAICQEALQPRPSPMYVATMKYEDAYIKVTYCRPHKKDREIFGGLVPFGKVWRTGANEATEITLTRDINIGGKILKAGSYTIFTIPESEICLSTI